MTMIANGVLEFRQRHRLRGSVRGDFPPFATRFLRPGRIERGARLQHGAGNGEEAVGDGLSNGGGD